MQAPGRRALGIWKSNKKRWDEEFNVKNERIGEEEINLKNMRENVSEYPKT